MTAQVSTETDNSTTTTLTAELSTVDDASNLDAINEEEDVLDPAQIVDGDNDNAPDPEDEDPANLPNNDFCFTEDDFLESLSNMNDATRHRSKWRDAWQIIKGLEGEEVVCQNAADGKVAWKVITECDEDIFESIRIRELEILKKTFNPIIPEAGVNDPDCCDRFWDVWPRSVDTDLERINIAIDTENTKNKESYKRTIRSVNKDEYFIFHALMIASMMYVQQGSALWKEARKNLKKRRVGFSDEIDFGEYMKWWRFKQIKYFVPIVMEDTTMQADGVDWWRFKDHIIKHNENKKQKIRSSHVHVFDESLSSFIPRLVFCLFGRIYFIF